MSPARSPGVRPQPGSELFGAVTDAGNIGIMLERFPESGRGRLGTRTGPPLPAKPRGVAFRR
ncbi:hypothetical protein [Amycolatopsis sp. NPDC051371]|uniref:hypothetical protein n=1 Tax=Amycolatopsis sp. NPDC051371 TaxID=3155800 RepID=UPI00341B7736